MALPKKGLRKITVGNIHYAWSVTGNDEYIHLSVGPLDTAGQLLSTGFGYHLPAAGDYYSFEEQPFIQKGKHFIITPGIVRQIIDYALQKGWNPQEKGPQFHLADKGHLILRLPK